MRQEIRRTRKKLLGRSTLSRLRNGCGAELLGGYVFLDGEDDKKMHGELQNVWRLSIKNKIKRYENGRATRFFYAHNCITRDILYIYRHNLTTVFHKKGIKKPIYEKN